MKSGQVDSFTTSDQTAIIDPRLLEVNGTRVRLKASRCRACHAYNFPRSELCSSCMSQENEEVFLSEEGTIYSFCTVHQGAPGWTVPYTLAYVDLPEGVRVLANLDVAKERLAFDLKVRLGIKIVAQDQNGLPLRTYVFKE